ncbi:MAG: peptide-methionine (S)-S-oxide reductase MsrA [Bacteroidota bacterium]|nr:peptide-methionine (S)-S-oxide reductase MsrA [Bacteroidota bacterium]
MGFLSQDIYAQNNTNMKLATFGSGCFWCTEAIFDKVEGVESAVSGYSGGKVKNPTYKEVCTGNTGHAEVVQIIYNPEIITYKDLLEIFWEMHDPTTLNRQGADVGTQYRSVIFYHTNEQKEIAETYKKKLNEAKVYKNPIVTEITQFESFYKAENHHQEYYENNKSQPYCSFVITPKLEKFKKVFQDKLK